MNKKTILTLLCSTTLALCMGCTASPPLSTPSNSDYSVSTLKLEGGTDWGAPNPFLCQSRGPGTAKMKLVYGSLLEKDEEGDVPWLAESWTVDGSDYTFTLFDNASFQDGNPLTAQDVAFTLDYYREHPPVSNPLGVGEDFLVDHYTVVDDHTITLTVDEPDADTLSNLGSFVILPQHIWSKVEDPYSYTGEGYLVGSGAFSCTQYDGATGLYEFTAYEGWCNGTQGTEKIQFIPVSDPLLAFDAGELDITSLPADLKDSYLSDPNIGLVDKANDMGYKLLINYEACPEFLDLTYRQAVYAAIDRQSVVDNVFRGAGTVGSAGYVPQGSIFYNEHVVQYDYDPQKAQEVLGGQNLSVTLLCGNSADDLAIAEIIKNGLTQAGMTVSVTAYDSATRDDTINRGTYEFALVGNGGWGNNPPTYMRTLFSDVSKFSGTNPHSMGAIGYSNAEMTRLAEGQQYETDFDQRLAMFQELELLVSQEIPILVIANQSTYSMYRKDYYDGWMKTYALLSRPIPQLWSHPRPAPHRPYPVRRRDRVPGGPLRGGQNHLGPPAVWSAPLPRPQLHLFSGAGTGFAPPPPAAGRHPDGPPRQPSRPQSPSDGGGGGVRTHATDQGLRPPATFSGPGGCGPVHLRQLLPSQGGRSIRGPKTAPGPGPGSYHGACGAAG